MTSTFQELRAKAIAWCRDFEQYKEECQVFAERIRIEYIGYLGAKSTDLEFHVLDERLDRMGDAGTTLSPRLQVGDDGFLYFGLTLFFKADGHCLDEHVRVGVQRGRGHWRVRWNHVEFSYSLNGPHDAFFEKITAVMMDKFTTPFRKTRGPLGFIPVLSKDHLALVPVSDSPLAAEAGGRPAEDAP